MLQLMTTEAGKPCEFSSVPVNPVETIMVLD